jgi:hypothetical protein
LDNVCLFNETIVTRDKYQKRLGKFFEFLGLEGGTIEQKSKVFLLILQEKTAIGPLTAS